MSDPTDFDELDGTPISPPGCQTKVPDPAAQTTELLRSIVAAWSHVPEPDSTEAIGARRSLEQIMESVAAAHIPGDIAPALKANALFEEQPSDIVWAIILEERRHRGLK